MKARDKIRSIAMNVVHISQGVKYEKLIDSCQMVPVIFGLQRDPASFIRDLMEEINKREAVLIDYEQNFDITRTFDKEGFQRAQLSKGIVEDRVRQSTNVVATYYSSYSIGDTCCNPWS